MARPSPRTLGVTTDEEGKEVYFTKFGTQQLVKDPTSPTGVRQLNTGQNFKMFTTAPVRAFKETFGFSPFGSPTPRDEFYPPMTITKGVGTTTPPAFPKGNGNGTQSTCTTCDSDKCQECNAWDVGCELGHMFAGTCTPPEKPPDEECDLGCLMTFRGCDCGCKDVKPCTTCDSTVCKECNAWDLQCEDCKKKDGTCTPPISEECGCLPYDFGCEIGCWWEKNKNYVYLIGGLIGLGVLLWLLRPLFGMIGAFKGGSP